jgi:hypothetical protein
LDDRTIGGIIGAAVANCSRVRIIVKSEIEPEKITIEGANYFGNSGMVGL